MACERVKPTYNFLLAYVFCLGGCLRLELSCVRVKAVLNEGRPDTEKC